MSKRAGSWQEEHLPNSYVIAWRQTGPTAVSRTSGMVKLMDPGKNVIEMCGGWGYGEDEDPQGYYLRKERRQRLNTENSLNVMLTANFPTTRYLVTPAAWGAASRNERTSSISPL